MTPTPKSAETLLDELEIKRSHLKGGILKSYKNADDWSSNYLNDQMKNLKEYDQLGDWLRSALSSYGLWLVEEGNPFARAVAIASEFKDWKKATDEYADNMKELINKT